MYSHCVEMFDLGFFTGTFRRGCRVVASLCLLGFLPTSLNMLSIKSENLLNAQLEVRKNLKWIEVRKKLVFRFGSLESILPY
jgi:hypothetical protein